MAKRAVHVIISGRVQGVGFRAWTAGKAEKLQLNGWVRNVSDGTVEALFAGDEVQVTEMLEACQKGPLAAKVKDIQHEPWQEGDVPQGFERRASA